MKLFEEYELNREWKLSSKLKDENKIVEMFNKHFKFIKQSSISRLIIQNLIEHKNIPLDCIIEIAKSEDANIKFQMCTYGVLNDEICKIILSEPNPNIWILDAMAGNSTTPIHILLELSNNENRTVSSSAKSTLNSLNVVKN